MPAIKPDQLELSIKSGKLGSLYLFDGPENWLKEAAASKIIDRLVPTEGRDFNLEKFDGRQGDPGTIVSSAQSLPWMGDRKVLLVSSAEEFSASESKIIVEGLTSLPSSTCLVFLYEGKANLREEIPAFVLSHGQTVTFWTPFPNQLPLWVSTRVKQEGKTISMDAARAIAEACGDLQEINNEIVKLLLFIGAKKSIEMTDIMAHGLPEATGDFKDLESAIWNRDVTEALRQGDLLSRSGVRPEMIFPVIERIFKNLLLGSFLITTKKQPIESLFNNLGIRGMGHQENFRKGLKSYSSEEIRSAFKLIVKADLELKTGALAGPLIMSLLLLNLCGKKRKELVLR